MCTCFLQFFLKFAIILNETHLYFTNISTKQKHLLGIHVNCNDIPVIGNSLLYDILGTPTHITKLPMLSLEPLLVTYYLYIVAAGELHIQPLSFRQLLVSMMITCKLFSQLLHLCAPVQLN